jgi:transcriptional regulator with XRE-family HTH domain
MMNEQADVKKTLSILVDNMRQRRRVLGISQEQLAERVGVSVNHVSKIEVGLKTPSLGTTIKIARALEMEPSDLFADECAEWMDESHELGFALRSLPDTEAKFLIDQFRSSLKIIKKLLKD